MAQDRGTCADGKLPFVHAAVHEDDDEDERREETRDPAARLAWNRSRDTHTPI